MLVERDVTILVQSCDKNEDLWPVFFGVFYRQWPDCPYEVILNTETKKYVQSDRPIKTVNVGEDDSATVEIPWSDRYLRVLEQIRTKYVLVFLDDFFPRERIYTASFEALVNKIDSINEFACVYFNFQNKPVFYNKELDLFFIHPDTWSRVNSVCGLWKREELIQTLIPGESPWEYEPNATQRYKKRKTMFYAANYDTSPIKLLFSEQLVRGKWSMDCVNLLQSMEIKVDFDQRGIVEFPYRENRILRYRHEKIIQAILHSRYIYELIRPIRLLKKKWSGQVKEKSAGGEQNNVTFS